MNQPLAWFTKTMLLYFPWHVCVLDSSCSEQVSQHAYIFGVRTSQMHGLGHVGALEWMLFVCVCWFWKQDHIFTHKLLRALKMGTLQRIGFAHACKLTGRGLGRASLRPYARRTIRHVHGMATKYCCLSLTWYWVSCIWIKVNVAWVLLGSWCFLASWQEYFP